MTDLDMTTDVETADFTDELSDEALDREEGMMAVSYCSHSCRGDLTDASMFLNTPNQ